MENTIQHIHEIMPLLSEIVFYTYSDEENTSDMFFIVYFKYNFTSCAGKFMTGMTR
jgi:hypothetical protein